MCLVQSVEVLHSSKGCGRNLKNIPRYDLLFRRVAGDSPRSIWRSSKNSSMRIIIIILYGAHWGSSYSRRAYKAPDKDDLISVAPRIAYIQNVNPLLQCPPAPYFR